MAAVTPAILLESSMTTLVVGPDKRKYVVHTELLRQKLRYFAKALNTPTAEKVVYFFESDHVSEKALRSLLAWLYTGKVFTDPATGEPLDDAIPRGRLVDDWDPFEELMDEDGDCNGDNCNIEDESHGNNEHTANDGPIANTEFDADTEPPASSDHHVINETPIVNEADADGEGDDDNESDVDPEGGDMDDEYHLDQFLMTSQVDLTAEDHLIRDVFPDSNSSRLDAYQLTVLIGLHERDGWRSDKTYLPKWKTALDTILDRKKSPAGQDHQGEHGFYDFMVELYTLADRFGADALCSTILDHLDLRQKFEHRSLQEQHLPRPQTVQLAWDYLPETSPLRQWLLFVFLNHWRPSRDTPEQAAARRLLPRAFILDLADVAVERDYYAVGDGDYRSWTAAKLNYDLLPNVVELQRGTTLEEKAERRRKYDQSQGGPSAIDRLVGTL